MVYIHGGGFEGGSGERGHCGPDYLIAEDIIMVTFNYRVGVLGFLFMEEASPGNVGLKDQVAALRWVQRNIAAFGGDPGNVTIFGPSAGGASVHFQMLSPMSKGLFHRAIAMSGSALNPWAHQTEPAATARRLARLLGCTSDDPHAIVDFLRTVDHMQLVRTALKESVPEKDKERLVYFSFVPTPELVVPGVETFLPAPVEQLMKEGRHHDVPCMFGMTSAECLFVLYDRDLRNETIAKELDEKWRQSILTELRIPSDGHNVDAALRELRQFFMGGKRLSNDTFNGFLTMLSDLVFREGVMYAVSCIASKSSAPVYQYLFSVEDQLNTMKTFFKLDLPGACHGDEKGYMFDLGFVHLDAPEDSSAALTRRRLVRLLTNFAKHGDPTPEDDPVLGVRWKTYTKEENNCLNIGNRLQNGTDLFDGRVAFWKKFYEKFGS